MKTSYLRILPFFIFVMLALFLWRGLALDPHHLPLAQMGQPLPLFALSQLTSSTTEKTALFTNKSVRGHIALLNVWASWCAACQEEQVFLLQLAREGMPIYGLNYKDTTAEATQWLTKWGNPYRLIGADEAGRVAIDLGVYGAPETFLLDKTGTIRYRHVGALTATAWQHDFLPRIRQLEELG